MLNFNTIYKENHKVVLNFIFSKTRDMEVSQELANDVFLRIHANLQKYDENISSFKTWMMNITNHTVIDYWRKKKLETISINEQDENENGNWIYNAVTNNSNPEKKMINEESLTNFRNIINELPKTYVKTANLFFNKQYSYEEISQTLNMPLGRVKIQLFRIREMLESKNVKVK